VNCKPFWLERVWWWTASFLSAPTTRLLTTLCSSRYTHGFLKPRFPRFRSINSLIDGLINSWPEILRSCLLHWCPEPVWYPWGSIVELEVPLDETPGYMHIYSPLATGIRDSTTKEGSKGKRAEVHLKLWIMSARTACWFHSLRTCSLLATLQCIIVFPCGPDFSASMGHRYKKSSWWLILLVENELICEVVLECAYTPPELASVVIKSERAEEGTLWAITKYVACCLKPGKAPRLVKCRGEVSDCASMGESNLHTASSIRIHSCVDQSDYTVCVQSLPDEIRGKSFGRHLSTPPWQKLKRGSSNQKSDQTLIVQSWMTIK